MFLYYSRDKNEHTLNFTDMRLQNTTFATDKAIKKADSRTYLIGMKDRFIEEFDDESERLDVFTVFVMFDPKKSSFELVKFVFTKKTGKEVYSKKVE